MNPSLAVTAELARLFEKVYALRQRVWVLAFLYGAAGASLFWLTSLLVFGALNLVYPFPTPVRLGFLICITGNRSKVPSVRTRALPMYL